MPVKGGGGAVNGDCRRDTGIVVTLSLSFLSGQFPGAGTYNFGKNIFSMRKLVALFFFVFLVAGAGRLQAQSMKVQSLKGTNWKFYVEALHDTLTMHIMGDSSYTTSTAGEMIVRGSCKLSNDTLRLRDTGGEYFCPDGEGVYRISIDGDYMSFFLVTDPCNGRGEALNGNKFRKSESK
jgi:hypothetical protein